MSDAGKAVFLSYASQDAEAAKRICDALRQGGVEVWFDAEGGLEHGDEWDAKIRRQIKECVLFIAVISAHTQAREEGYFRIEWDLAAERARGIASGVAFILPVVVDDTREPDALVPDRFRAVQWTRIPGGVVPPAVLARFLKLWSHRTGVLKHKAGQADEGAPLADAREPVTGAGRRPTTSRTKSLLIAVAVLVFGTALYFTLQPRRSPEGGANKVDELQKPDQQVTAPTMASVPLSAARQLSDRARALSFDKYDSTPDDFAAAEGMLKQALELDPNDAEIWAASSQLNKQYQGRGFDHSSARATAALSQAQRACKLNPDSIEAQYALGFAERGTDPAAAEQIMRKILARQPDHPGALFTMSNLAYRQGKAEESLGYLERVAAQPKMAALAAYLKYLTYFSRARFAEADQAIRQSIAVQPSANSVAGLAMVLLTWKGDADGAARVFAEAPTTFRNEPRTVWMTALVQLCRRAPDEALNVLDRLPDEYIQDNWLAAPKAYYIGRAQALAGRPEAARAAWEAGLAIMQARLKTAPENVYLHLMNGELLALLGRDNEALHEARTVNELFRGKKMPWFLSPARIYAGLGRADEALPLLAELCPPRAGDDPGWPLTPALLRLDPLWDKIRDDARFKKLALSDETVAGAAARVVDDKSVAVLAFANLSDDKENEYFSDGISEELLNVLAKIPGLKVSARTSAFYFKGKEVPVPEIARQLGVAYVVEGSVRRQGTKVRITAQLIKAADGFHVWSDTFTRELKDIFAVQDEIAGLIAQNLELKMGVAAARPTIDLEAYQEYLTGRALFAKAGNGDLQEAVRHFEKAVAIDPRFTAAWVQLASVHTQRGRWGGAPTLQSWAAARAAINHALALEPDSPDTLLALGWILRTADWDWRGAEHAFRRSLQLRPDQPDAMAGLAVLLFNIGKKEEAFRLGQQAAVLDPLNPATQIDLSLMFYLNNNLAEAERSARRALQLAPGGAGYHCILAWSLIGQGRLGEAEAEVGLDSDAIEKPLTYGLLALARGQGAVAREKLAELENISRTNAELADLQNSIAWISVGLGEKDRPFAALEKARASRDPSNSWLRSSSYLDPLHSDPRWNALLHQVGLADDMLK